MAKTDGKLYFDVEFDVADFKQTLKKISNETAKTFSNTSKKTADTFKQTSKVATDELKKIPKETDKTAKKVETSMQKAGKIVSGVITSLVAGFTFKSILSNVLSIGTEFENGLAKVSTLVDTNTVDMKVWGKELRKVSDETGIAIGDVTEATYQALSAGVKQTDVTNLLTKANKLAVGGYTDVTTAIDTVTSITNAYNLTAEDTDRITKILIQTQNKGKTTVGELGSSLSNVIPTAVQMGFELESLGAALSVLTANGIPTAQATTKLNSLLAELGKTGTKGNKAMMKLYEGTKFAGKSFEELLKMKNINEILADMNEYAKKSGVTMADFFGSIEAGSAAAILGTTGFDSFNDALQSMGTNADVVQEAFDKNLTTSQKWQIITNQLRNTFIDLFEAILPFLTPIIDGISALVRGFTNLDEPTRQFVLVIGLLTVGLLTLIPILSTCATAATIFASPVYMIVGIVALVIAGITALIFLIKAMIKGFYDADSKLGSFARGSINLVIKGINLLISGLNLLISTINLIPGVNIPKIEHLKEIQATYGSKTDKNKSTISNNTKSTNSNMNNLSNVPKLAKGGQIANGGLFIAGEKGKELLMTENGKTTVIPLNNNQKSNSGMNNVINMTFNVNNNIDERKLSNMVLTKLARNLR